MRTWKEILSDNRIDDSGDYDYLAEELPQDNAEWHFGVCKCESCNKYRRLTLTSKHYFYCYDGWDYMSYNECWRCFVGASIRRFFHRLQKHFKKK